MTANRTEHFAEALNTLESGGELDEFLSVFADDVQLTRPETSRQRDGQPGARSFWTDYLGVFADIHSDCSRITDADPGVLEWTSTGRLSDGAEISYTGVSILDFDGADKITRFTTYFDTAPFTRAASA